MVNTAGFHERIKELRRKKIRFYACSFSTFDSVQRWIITKQALGHTLDTYVNEGPYRAIVIRRTDEDEPGHWVLKKDRKK